MAVEADLQGDVDDAGFGDGQQIGGAGESHALDMPARRLANGFRKLAMELEWRSAVEPRQRIQGEVSIETVAHLGEDGLDVGEIGRLGRSRGHVGDASAAISHRPEGTASRLWCFLTSSWPGIELESVRGAALRCVCSVAASNRRRDLGRGALSGLDTKAEGSVNAKVRRLEGRAWSA